jgi:predicted dehydrogenase
MNIAFAGFKHGHIFSLYSRAKENQDVNIVAAYEQDAEFRKNAIQNHGVEFTHETYDELLKEAHIDIIAIGEYYGARGEMVIKALKAGKHVIADKPLCTSIHELEPIAELVEKTGLKVGCMLTMRYLGSFAAVRDYILSGKLGKINNIYFGGQHPLLYGTRPMWYFEEGKHGGVINDIAIHGIDMAYYACGLRVSDILSARCWNAYAAQEPQFKDSAQFMLKMSNGAGLIADVSYAVPNSIGFDFPYAWEFNIWGSKGMIHLTHMSEEAEAYLDGETEVVLIPEKEVQHHYLDDFLKEIKGDKDVLLCTNEVLQSTKDTLLIQMASE